MSADTFRQLLGVIRQSNLKTSVMSWLSPHRDFGFSRHKGYGSCDGDMIFLTWETTPLEVRMHDCTGSQAEGVIASPKAYCHVCVVVTGAPKNNLYGELGLTNHQRGR